MTRPKRTDPGLYFALGAIVFLLVAATTDEIWRDVFDSSNNALRVVGLGGAQVVDTAGGTTNRVAKFSDANTLANSLLSDDGTNVTLTSGQHLAPDGSVSAPAYSFSGDTDTGWYRTTTPRLKATLAGVDRLSIGSALALPSGGVFAWSSTSDSSGTADVEWTRGAANVAKLADSDMLQMGGGAPAATDCDAAAEEGRLWQDTTAGIFYTCDQTGASTGWAVILDYSS